MKYINLEISDSDNELMKKREHLKDVISKINEAKARGDEVQANELTNEVQNCGVNVYSICGDGELLCVFLDILPVETKEDNRRYCTIYNKVEAVKIGVLELTDEEHRWLVEKSNKINYGEKIRDQSGNMQDRFPGVIRRALNTLQEKIEKAQDKSL